VAVLEKAKVSWNGQMAQSTMANGKKGSLTAKELSTTPTEICMKANGRIIDAMAMAFTQTNRDQFTKEIGKTTCNMAKALRHGPKVPSLSGNTRMAKSKDLELISGLTEASTKVNGTITISMELASTSGKMDASTTESGRRMTCTV
jgi:hypothetical protein